MGALSVGLKSDLYAWADIVEHIHYGWMPTQTLMQRKVLGLKLNLICQAYWHPWYAWHFLKVGKWIGSRQDVIGSNEKENVWKSVHGMQNNWNKTEMNKMGNTLLWKVDQSFFWLLDNMFL